MFKRSATLAGSVFLVGLLVLPLPGEAALFPPVVEPCTVGELKEGSSIVGVALNAALHGYGERVFEVEVPAVGILSVELSVPAVALGEGKLALSDSLCRGPASREARILSRSVSQLVLAVDQPGTYVFRAAAQDPLRPLGFYKLMTGYVALTEIPVRPVPRGDPDEEVIEIEPDEALTEWDPGSDPRHEALLEELCRTVEIDDHGDRLLCATQVSPGQETAGEIDQGDDDYFQLLLEGSQPESLWTVKIETTGGADTFGSLYDRHGHRLAADDDGSDGNFRIVKALAPGSYFVRVEGAGSAATYVLTVTVSAW